MASISENPREADNNPQQHASQQTRDHDLDAAEPGVSGRNQGEEWLARRREGNRVRRRRGSIFRDLAYEAENHQFLREKRDKLRYITDQLDNNGFDWRVFLVASSGFLTDSYNLFVTNTVMPSIIYVYMYDNDAEARYFEMWINLYTLIGSILGQVSFGILADIMGRTTLYGIELLIVIFSTFGFAFSSHGILAESPKFSPSLDLKTSFYCWRFFMGYGIGAEYPLSAVLTAEWADVNYRAQMLAAVFAMQPLGQLFAAIAGLSAIEIVNKVYGLQNGIGSHQLGDNDARAIVDRVWRGVVGFGAIPAAVAFMFRFYITDPGRYTLEVQEDIDRAVEDTERQVWKNKLWFWKKQSAQPEQIELPQRQQRNQGTERTDDSRSSDPSQQRDTRQSWSDLWHYLWQEGNGALLFGTCVSWFLLDVAFFGLGISSPHTLSVVWASKPAPKVASKAPAWNPDPTQPDHTIYEVLKDNSKRLILTSALGSLVGSIMLIITINLIRRKWLLKWSFLFLSLFLLATALAMRYAFGSKYWGVTFAFYVICQIMFNFGPNTLTFIIPAEIFPTRYRCSFHGLSAASGKLGSVVIQAILSTVISKDNDPGVFNSQAKKLSWVLIGFSFVMAGGFPITEIFIPDVQQERGDDAGLESKTLEALAPGIPAADRDKQVLGGRWFREHWPAWLTPGRRSQA